MGTQEFQNKLMSLQGNLLNFAYMLTSNRDNAYDLLQDTTLKALDNEGEYVKISITSIFLRIQVLKPPKDLLVRMKSPMPSMHFPTNTVYRSQCMWQVTSTTRSQRR